ncbi:MAG: hypothetical protein AABZ85_09105, partial [Thermodesulfobacteriota bacterium]
MDGFCLFFSCQVYQFLPILSGPDYVFEGQRKGKKGAPETGRLLRLTIPRIVLEFFAGDPHPVEGTVDEN